MSKQHCGFIAIIGRPNVGKSTLLNHLVGQKISITSRKAQTTRHRITGIHTEDAYQTVFVDTPGLHKDEKQAINRLMNKAATSSITDVDAVIFVVDSKKWTEEDELVLKKLQHCKVPVLLAINKVDKIKNKEDLLPILSMLSSKYNFNEIIPLSAEKGDNTKALMQWVHKQLPEGEHYFDEDSLTNRSSRFLAAEIIREKLMRLTGDELPYSVAVEIERFVQEPSGLNRINALILVERETQKPMIIGNKGERLKRVGQEARVDMEKLFGCKVFLELWVKVKSGWADDERALKSLGYDDDEM